MKLLHSSERTYTRVPKFKIGQHVHIVQKKGTFEKSYTTNFTEEIFVISNVQPTNPTTYKIKDLLGEDIKGTFYEEELQKTDQSIYHTEKVLKRRKRHGKKEVYVKWEGYGKEFNSWISATDLQWKSVKFSVGIMKMFERITPYCRAI